MRKIIFVLMLLALFGCGGELVGIQNLRMETLTVVDEIVLPRDTIVEPVDIPTIILQDGEYILVSGKLYSLSDIKFTMLLENGKRFEIDANEYYTIIRDKNFYVAYNETLNQYSLKN